MRPSVVLVTTIALISGSLAGTSVVAADSATLAIGTQDFTASLRFGERDQVLIREYYAPHPARKPQGLPPGLAKKGKLPPGHAKRLVRNRAVSPDVAYTTLPARLEARLTPLPADFVRVTIDGEFAILDTKTRIAVDVFDLLD